MSPDFIKNTIDTLAKRAVYLCSNPECRVSTAGPNTDPQKATVIGEAAHIYGARSNSARYRTDMTDIARREITNGIWLCRNCHKKIDRDAQLYPAELLFSWREVHEQFVTAELGNRTEQLLFEIENSIVHEFDQYPPIIRRIVIDKPTGWEWRLTAELLKHINKPHFRRLKDLRDNLYTKPLEHIEEQESIKWVSDRLSEMWSLVSPIEKLMQRLTASWGKPGQPGDAQEIHHICLLIRDCLIQVIEFEDRVSFVRMPEKFDRLSALFRDVLGSQIDKLGEIPEILDDIVSQVNDRQTGSKENPKIIKKTITFEPPKDWSKKFDLEIQKINKSPQSGSYRVGWSTMVLVTLIIYFLLT